MVTVGLFFGLTLIAVALLERFVKPRSVERHLIWRRSLLATMPVVVFYFTVFMIFYRPVFSTGLTLILFGLIVVLNNAKYAALREPLAFSDFSLLRQVIQQPRLYVTYIGVWRLVALGLLAVGVTVSCLIAERPVIERDAARDWLPSAIFLLTMVGIVYAISHGPLRGTFVRLLDRFGPKLRLEQDVSSLSLVACLICYFFLARVSDGRSEQRRQALARQQFRVLRGRNAGWTPPVSVQDCLPSLLPDIVVIQSESFFDARRLHPDIDRAVLAGYSRVSNLARYRGHVTVPAWGANTLRTEFAFLSGLPNAALGIDSYNPYTSLCRRPTWTIAQQLRGFGYICTCVHPFHSNFFERDTVFPNFGFYRFLDISEFGDAERIGEYVSDVALGERVQQELEASQGPRFIFAITMQNHGKWDEDRFGLSPDERGAETAPLNSPELGQYLRHLEGSDRMIVQLAEFLKRRGRPAVFCFYGDHVPSLPMLYNRLGYDDPRTDYFVWTTESTSPIEVNVPVESLGRLVLDSAFSIRATFDSEVPATPEEL